MLVATWLCTLLTPVSAQTTAQLMSATERLQLRENVREMFHHGYDAYMRYAFPHDELKPLSRSFTDSLVELGNAASPTREGYRGVALSLIDSLDTLAVLGNVSEFHWAVEWVGKHVSFDQDVEVSVFETNIRLLGGLLSAHMLAAGEAVGGAHVALEGYDGALLRLAVDLGDRLLVAFNGGCAQLPSAFVNLKGTPARDARREQCTAGVGTLLLEMGVLSRLSGDSKYEDAALCALRLLWSKRSKFDLLGNTLDVNTGTWRNAASGIGSGIDSFYEYLLKGYLVFGHAELFGMWNASYAAVLRHLKRGAWYGEANMHGGGSPHDFAQFDALSAFWPALQVLVGDVEQAASTHAAFHSLWRMFGALPERYDVRRKSLYAGAWAEVYPLRPELAESCYALYRATGNHSYLHMGAEMVRSLNSLARTDAGFAAISSVRRHTQDDHMASYFLAETLKYLYLLYDEDNFLHAPDSTFVFSTEAHIIPLSPRFSSDAAVTLHVDKMAVAQLRQLVASAGLSSADCVERHELRDRARQAQRKLQSVSRAAQHAQRAAHALPRPDEVACAADEPAARSVPRGGEAPRPPPQHAYTSPHGLALFRSDAGIRGQLDARTHLWAAAQAVPWHSEPMLHVVSHGGAVTLEWLLQSNGSLSFIGATHTLSLHAHAVADARARAAADVAASTEKRRLSATLSRPAGRATKRVEHERASVAAAALDGADTVGAAAAGECSGGADHSCGDDSGEEEPLVQVSAVLASSNFESRALAQLDLLREKAEVYVCASCDVDADAGMWRRARGKVLMMMHLASGECAPV
uniref:alpha-1,2-Mannosidase n=1 Tax=Chrysotila carterae TaxID=13221 RepID=A0A7S4B7D7_CHRCT